MDGSKPTGLHDRTLNPYWSHMPCRDGMIVRIPRDHRSRRTLRSNEAIGLRAYFKKHLEPW